MAVPACSIKIKIPPKHVEAVIEVISGRGFNSPRLQLVKNPLIISGGFFLRSLGLDEHGCAEER